MNEDLSKLNLVELIDRLEMVPPPEPVSLWPQTIGWLWLGLAIAGLVAYAIHLFVRRHRANAYRRAALKALGEAGGDPSIVASILRRTALTAYPRAEVATLHGDDWLAYLDQAYDGSGFREGPGRVLATAPYTSAPAVEGLDALAADWVRRHRSEPA